MVFLTIFADDRRIRIQKAQKHTDPTDPDSDSDTDPDSDPASRSTKTTQTDQKLGQFEQKRN